MCTSNQTYEFEADFCLFADLWSQSLVPVTIQTLKLWNEAPDAYALQTIDDLRPDIQSSMKLLLRILKKAASSEFSEVVRNRESGEVELHTLHEIECALKV